MNASVAIRQIAQETPDVLRVVTDRPNGLEFRPGQAAEVRIDKDEFRDEPRPFTFVSLPAEPHLEFMIKTYPERDGVTDSLRDLTIQDRLIISRAFGDIHYAGPGVFIAGGAGITPFLAIFRDLQAGGRLDDHWLYFANEREEDIIAAAELKNLLGDRARFLITDESSRVFDNRQIDASLLHEIFHRHRAERYYLCGPPAMVDMIQSTLRTLGVPDNAFITDR